MCVSGYCKAPKQDTLLFHCHSAILFSSLSPLSSPFSFIPGRRLHRGGWGMKGGPQRKMSERGRRENNATPVWSVWERGREWHREGREKRGERERCYQERCSLLFTHCAFWSTAWKSETEEEIEKDNDWSNALKKMSKVTETLEFRLRERDRWESPLVVCLFQIELVNANISVLHHLNKKGCPFPPHTKGL